MNNLNKIKIAAALCMSVGMLFSCTEKAPTATTQELTPVPTPTESEIITTSPPLSQAETTPTVTEEVDKTFTVYYHSNNPVGGRIEGNLTQTVKKGETAEPVVAIPAEGYIFCGWSDGSKDPRRTEDVITKNREIYASFEMETISTNIATISIQTDSGKWIYSKEYVTAKITVEGSENGEYDGTFTTRIKGRGNSSWNGSAAMNVYDSKNSYRLKLDESQKFLGIGDSKNKDWVLNSCKFDASLLRNKIGYMMGEMLGIDYNAECTWAHVYLNGDYRGVYMVVEHVEVAKDRIEVDDSIEAEDNGFMLELDMRGDKEGEAGVDYFYVDGYAENESNAREWVIKSDMSQDPEMAKKQHDYIKNYITEVNRAIETGNREEIEKWVDLDSFINMFICSEFSKDVDVNTASFFMYKEQGGKLKLTCPWDYDFGFGTYYIAIDSMGLITETKSGNQWFARLLKETWFMKLVYERMLQVENDVYRIMDKTVAIGKGLIEASDKNDERWGVYGNKYHVYVDFGCSSALESYPEHLDFLYYWMYERWDNMKIAVEIYSGEYEY